jgi:CheY-like chemotaxis protein
LIRGALEEEGFRVTAASNGREALRRWGEPDRTPDLVITDLIMPEMEGIELLRKLGQRQPRVPIIVMSGHQVGRAFLESARLLGARASLPKPFSMDELIRTVNQALASSGPRQQ